MKLLLTRSKVKDKDKIYVNGRMYVKGKKLYVKINEDKEKELGGLYYKELGRNVTKWVKDKEIKKVSLDFDNLFKNIKNANNIIDFLLGLHISKLTAKDYNSRLPVFGMVVDNDLKTKHAEPLYTFSLGKHPGAAIKILDSLKYTTEALSFVIKTINTPHNLLSLENIKYKIFDLFKNMNNVDIAILDDNYLKKNDYNLIRAVAKAGNDKPYIVHISYRPDVRYNKPSMHKVLVGKGVHFDSGGINTKPYDSMVDMKYDKTGALTALATLYIVAKLNLNIKLDVVVGFTENMISNKGYKSGDVLKAKNGKTVEIVHTDAEGRLLLADCLQYVDVVIKNHDGIITLATLTGAARRALGEYTAAIHSLEYQPSESIIKTGKQVGESLNYMYPHPKLKDSLKSKIADIANLADTELAGSITAYWFLTHFTENPEKLTHIDLAGVAWTDDGFGYVDYGSTGFGVRTLVRYLTELHASSLTD